MVGAVIITARPRPTPTTGPRILFEDDSLDDVIDEVLIAPTRPLRPAPRRAVPPPLPAEARRTANLRIVSQPAPEMPHWSPPPRIATPPSRPTIVTARSMLVTVRRAVFGVSVVRTMATFAVGAALVLLVGGARGWSATPQTVPYVIHVTSTPAAPVVTPLAPVETTCPAAVPAAPARREAAPAKASSSPRHHARARRAASWSAWVDPFAD